MNIKCEICEDVIIFNARHRPHIEFGPNLFACDECIEKAKKRTLKRELKKMKEER